MFNCANISAGQASTYYKLDDYYTEKSHVPARVMGALAERLGLSGEFNSAKFNAALHGEFEFNGSPIEIANKPSLKRAAYDCVFSAPKSVSIEALVHGEKGVVEAHKQAVEMAMREVQNLIRARVTKDGKTYALAAEAVYFEFLHETSRNVEGELPDPDLHTHNVIPKLVLVKDSKGNEKLYALNNEEIFQAQKMLDAVYKQELAQRLRSLGYELEMTKHGFEIAGYSREQIEAFSKRTEEIDNNLAEQGLSRENSTGKQREAANLKKRKGKGIKTFSRAEMRQAWKEQSRQFNRPMKGIENEHYRTAAESRAFEQEKRNSRAAELGHREATKSDIGYIRRERPPTSRSGVRSLSSINVVHNAQSGEMLLSPDVRLHLDDKRANPDYSLRRLNGTTGELTAHDAVDVAIKHFAERQVAIGNRYQIIEFAIKSGEFDFPLADIRAAVDKALEDGRLTLGYNGKALVITQAYEDEKALAASYESGLGVVQAAATIQAAKAGIKQMETAITSRLISEKEKALGRPLHDNERNNLIVKLNEKQVAMIEKIATSSDRFNVIVGDAGTGKSTGMEAAKIVLESQGFNVLGLAPSGSAVSALSEAGLDTKTVQHAFHNPKYWESVNEKTVIVLDEAGLVDIETMRLIQERVTEKGARLALVGDPKQYGSVKRGVAMYQLCKLAKTAGVLVNLDKMQRGRNEFMRSLHFASRDKPEDSLDMLFKNKMVTAIGDNQTRLETIANMYLDMDIKDRQNALVLTGKNIDRVQINEAIRSKLGLSEGVQINSLEMYDATIEATKMLASYEREDFIKLNKTVGDWKSGTMLQVVDKLPDAIVVRDRDGFEKTLHPREFGNSVSIGQVEKIEITKGDRVRFTAAYKDNGVINGDRGEITRVENGKAYIKLDRTGQEVDMKLDDKKPLSIRYAYSQTGHSAQGATAKMFDQLGQKPNVILCTNAGDNTIDAKSWYTNITRAADQVHVVTNATTARQIEDLRTRISLRKDKDTAQDLIKGKEYKAEEKERVAYLAPAHGDSSWQRLEIPKDATDKQLAEVLQMAQAQYGKDLFVSGSESQQKTVAQIAGKTGLEVKFDDKKLEKIRKYHLEKRNAKAIANQAKLEAKKALEAQKSTTKTIKNNPATDINASAEEAQRFATEHGYTATIATPDNKFYTGSVLARTSHHVIQSRGKSNAMIYEVEKLQLTKEQLENLQAGAKLNVNYRTTKPTIEVITKEQERTRQQNHER